MRRLIPVVAAAALLPLPAFAHTGIGPTEGFTAGFLHPLGGLDHLMAMVAVGLWAGMLGGRARWALPGAFLAAMTLGGVLGMAGYALPYVEFAIAASVVVLGAMAAMAARPPLAAAVAMAGLFGLAHGHAHGTEMLPDAGAATYAAGFLLATAGLHALGLAASTVRGPRIRIAARATGAAMAVAMLVLVIGG